MKSQLNRLSMIGLIVLVFVLGLGGGVAVGQVLNPSQSNLTTANDGPNFGLIKDAWTTIQKVYVDRAALQSQPLTYGAISGMVNALGDTGHSTFLSPQMVQEERNLTQGKFEGIGIEVQAKNNNVVIVAPLDGSPAQRAGLRAGEVIIKVNGDDVTGLPLNQVVKRILGPVGTSVTLTVFDPTTSNTTTVTLTRATITLHNVTWQRLPGTSIADVRIAAFSNGVTPDLQQALKEIQQQHLTGIVLDLRNNPGGLLDEAVGTASQFLKSGNVLLEKNAQGQTKPVPIDSGGLAPDIPMVVLINQGTASAAEIVAGALQDAQRAKLVGETTFGTGTVLNEFPLPDGSALLLATEEWLTPKGRVIWHTGISPDITVALPLTATLLLPETERNMTAAQLQASGDQQMLRALELLSSSAQK